MLLLTRLKQNPGWRWLQRREWVGILRRRAAFVWFASICNVLLLGACARGGDEAEFSLDPRTGMPVVQTGREHYQLDWRGRMVFGFIDEQRNAGRTASSSGTSLDLLPTELAAGIAPQLGGAPKFVFIAPPAPQGWHQCLAVTTCDKPEAQPGQAVPEAPHWQASFFDAQSGQALAELDLNEVYESLYYTEPDASFRAEVRSASTGPDGGIGLLLWFAQGGDYYLDGGIWDGENWTPLVCVQPSGAGGHEQQIYVGPGNSSILKTPYSLFFSGADGRLLNIWILKGGFLRIFQQALIVELFKAVVLAAIGGLAGVAVLGFLWQMLTVQAKRRRLR